MKIRSEKPETPIKDRIRMFCASLNMTDRDFQAAANLGEGFMARQSEPVCTAIGNITRAFPKLSPDWLLTGFGPMLRPLRDHPNVTAITATDLITIDDAIDIDTPKVAEPTQPYKSAKKPETSLSDLLIESLQAHIADLQKQLENKDAQIATLLMKIPES